MKWKYNTEINKKIQEIQAEAQKVEKEIEIINSYRKEFSSIHMKFHDLYGKKYGINQRKVKRRVELNELQRMMHLIRAEDAQPQKVGFLGLGGLKKEDYYVFTDKLNLVESNLDYMDEDWEKYLASKVEELRVLLDSYENSYIENSSVYNSIKNLDVYETTKETDDNILIGTVDIKLPMEEYITALFHNKHYSFLDGEGMHMLTKMPLKEFSPCYIQYTNDEELNSIYSWIRNLYKQLLYKLPAFHAELLYLDGLHNAGGLKEFLSLQNVVEEYVPDIEQQLIGNYLKILSIKRDRESIYQELQNLEQYMGKVTDILQGESSFTVYNAEHEKKIPYRVVVLEGMDSYADITLLRKLLNNGPTCGVFVIYLQDARMIKKDAVGNSREYSEMMELFSDFPKIIFEDNRMYLVQGTEKCICTLFTEILRQTSFINDLTEKLGVKKEVDNNFETHFKEDYQWGQYTSTEKLPNGNLEGKIKIPFAIDKRGKIVSMELGSSNYVHGLISGVAGSGKSTMLHMIISSIIMNYHPKDVEIWLADYKQTEMSVYIANRPPHVKFIGIERNEEFSFSLIDLIFDEYERRSCMFVEQGVRNIDTYKEKFGMNSLPRILVIIDEFHLMSQQVHENPEYSIKLENILSEARAAGIVCLFADQAVSVGLKGLTEKGRKQMRQRLAMANDKEEMGITLDAKITEKEAILQKGEVVQKKLITRIAVDGTHMREAVLETNKVIYISDVCRENVAKKAIEIYGNDEDAIIVDGKQQAKLDWAKADLYEQTVKATGDERKKFYLHLGVPSNLENCYAIPLIKDYGQNIICIHDRYDLQKLILLNSLKSFLRDSDAKVYIIADENDALYLDVKSKLQELGKKYSNLILVSDMESVCKTILELNDNMIIRRKKPDKETDLVFWLGLDSMFREFQYYDELPAERKNTAKSRVDKEREALEWNMAALFGDDFLQEKSSDIVEKEEELLFDATEQVLNLIKEGAKRGIFQFVFMSNVLSIKNHRLLKLDYFTYKMSGYLDRDNSIEFYGNSRFMRSMSEKKDNISFICYDGRKARFFVPYLD